MYRLTWPLLLALLAVSCSASQEVHDDDDMVTIETEGDEEQREEVPYASPNRPKNAHFVEHFDSSVAFDKDWVRSKAKKDDADENIAKYDGVWSIEPLLKNPLVGDRGLVLKSAAKHAAISSRLTKPFHFLDKPLVVQFEVGLQNGQSCGGAYIKLLTDSPQLDLTGFRDQTPYTIMFGPDKCGNENKVHFIFRHRNPLTGEFEEKHAKRVSDKLEEAFSDKQVHQYRLIVRPDNTFQIYLDDRVINSGSLLEDMTPPVNPPSEIDDPEDFKPEDWDDRERIPDPDATKPDDWDEDAPAKISDPTAVKPTGWLDDELSVIPDPIASRPADWDDEMDGEWEAPMIDNPLCADAPGCGTWSPPIIDNPAYRGKWRRPMIANPDYRGKWAPRRIANPGYFEDKQPFKMTSIGAVGFELWSMTDGIYFDNVLVSDSLVEAQQFTDDTFALKVKQHGLKESTMMTRFLKYSSDRPWLFAIYVVVIGLPILLLLTYCCTTTKKSPDARHKKTDEVTEDDTIPEEPEEEAETSSGGKTAADAGDDPADDDAAADEANSAGDAMGAEADEQVVNPPLRTSPRKRRSRLE